MTVPIEPQYCCEAIADYLARAEAARVAHEAAREAIRTTLPAITDVVRGAAEQAECLLHAQMDETNPNVRGLQYEAQDKLKSVERLAGELRQKITEFVRVLAEQEEVTARVRAAAALVNPASPS